ncbi:cilia- and flagella-associated protein 57 isoform X1 [Nannospalax galili]|uniref:cilia- and flagella-associated protein 57 isoform X1 n=1 Tax=Nannospalax galili TaxID=1026970 RepID=UPI00111C4F3E|nr:cilia- and flagella-associated protein 57 isoform X1 [Nannospalax galili]XP_029425354.1 cilia- and flagella-associated protein 57 isoform X1 [Nannospalax galili]
MSTVVAQSLHVFGLRAHVANNIFFFDEQIIIYPSGNHCVKYNLDQKWQNFIPGSDKSQGMLALSISPNRRYLAISEMVQEKPTITIYELSSIPCRKRKVLNNFDFQVQKFVSMAFSPDSKYLLTQTSPPESNLVYWLWEKQKVMAVIRTDTQNNPVYQVSINPQDNTQVCATGNGLFKLLRFAEGTLKQTNFQRGESPNYLAHAWVSDDRIIVGTDTGRLFLFESGDQRWETNITIKEPTSSKSLEVIHKSESLIEFPSSSSPVPSFEQIVAATDHDHLGLPQVFAIAAYSKGFACSAGKGRVLLFEKVEDKDFYRESREIRIPTDPQSNDPSQSDKQDVLCLCFSPSEETLVASTSKNQIYSITMSLTEISKGEPAHFEYLLYPLHCASITGLATCIRKPLIATCSLDRSVRIWNYESNTLELFKEYQEEAYTVSLHPSGHYVVVGFADKLRLMNLLSDDIRPFKEYSVRRCKECSFSNGGHLFAAVNGNVIHIFTTTSLENITNLKGHTGKIRSVVWNSDDSKLISAGTDGAVYEWNLATGKRETECVLKSCSYNSIAVSPDAKIIFAVGSDQTLKEISDSLILREISAYDVIYTAITISHSGRMMFVGTSMGTIRTMKYPLPLQKEFNEYQAHAGPITKILLTFDDQFLLTVAEDGCLFTWKVFDKDGRGIKREREVGFAEEVLVTKTDMEEKAQVMLELKMRVEELKMENEYQLRLKDMNYSEKIKELTDKFTQEMESLQTKNQEKRIYDLKKKNQELEKFKFVFDYKIKELKKQIEARENEIKVMKEQIREMEAELERFHKQNTQLELNITELLQKLRATDQELRKEQQKERDLEALVRRFKTDLHNCVAYIQEPRLLKEKIRGLFEKYVQQADMVEIAGLNSDLQQEYARQREHLERNLATLKKKVVKESELHRTDYVRIMQENVSLIKEINELRRELKLTRSQVYNLESALKVSKKMRRPQEVPETAPSKDMATISPTMRLNEQEETGRIIEMQRLEIRRLRDQIQEQEQVPGFHTIAGVRLPSLIDSEVDFEVHTK